MIPTASGLFRHRASNHLPMSTIPLVSDLIARWRWRELAAGRLKLRGDATAWRTLELCAARTDQPSALPTATR